VAAKEVQVQEETPDRGEQVPD
jgi:pre-mRNA-splicing factor CWC22